MSTNCTVLGPSPYLRKFELAKKIILLFTNPARAAVFSPMEI